MLENQFQHERFHVYMLTVNVPAGGIMDVPLPLDSDSGFCARSVKLRNVGPDGAAAAGLRMRNNDGVYVHTAFTSSDSYAVAPGAASYPTRRGLALSPEVYYPPQATIRFDLANYTGAELPSVQVIVKGSKIFSGRGPASFPARMAPVPFIQNQLVVNLAPSGSAIQQAVYVEQECDYVFRGAVCDPGVIGQTGGPVRGAYFGGSDGLIGGRFTNLTAQLLDGNLKPYSNVPIPVDELFGQSAPFPSVTDGGQTDTALWRPGLFYPQIYVPRLEGLFVSFYRDDAAAEGACNLNIRWHGCKVYQS